jgi:hypothetical protein
MKALFYYSNSLIYRRLFPYLHSEKCFLFRIEYNFPSLILFTRYYILILNTRFLLMLFIISVKLFGLIKKTTLNSEQLLISIRN